MKIVKAAKFPKPIILTLIGNWVIAPALMALLARLFLSDYLGYASGVILLGIVPIAESVILFVGFPLALGQLSRSIIVKREGREWFNNRFRSVIGNIAGAALLAMIIILFSLKG